MKRSRPRTEDFTVGWICALPIERVAAEQVLDELYEDISSGAPYVLGRIGDHDVVTRCLPAGSIGLSSATRLATQMETDFSNIQIRLMVGIGGGVPSLENDVRLGDVVVSRPHKGHSGIVQYDFGKARPDGRFESTGYQNAPPQSLLEASGELEARTIKQTNKIKEQLHLFDTLPSFSRAQAGPDILFKAESSHVSSAQSCSNCDHHMIEARVPREDQGPVIHYGTIASGNQVIKDAITRDRRSSELGGVLCFETEAAGLMNSFPCLVIRGICDYADSHKNDSWHSYASATAAACAKEILLLISGVRKSDPDHSGSVPFVVSDRLRSSSSRQEVNSESIARQEVLESLAFTQIDSRLATIKTNHAKTCEWLLSQKEYEIWLDPSQMSHHHGFFWLKGKPGTGKSTIMKFLFARAKSTMSNPTTKVISFFFNARGEHLERSVEGMYRSLLHQLLTQFPRLRVLLDPFTSQKTHSWSTSTTRDIFDRAVEALDEERLICFVDALDECPEDEVRDMVESFEELGNTTTSAGIEFLVCFSSRHYPHISIEKAVESVLETQEGHEVDIKRYIDSKLGTKRSKKIPASINEMVLEKSSGIFLWVVLVVSLLNRAIDHNQIHRLSEILDALPTELEDLFVDLIQRDGEDLADLIICLQWILFAGRPLRPEELYFGVRVGHDGEDMTPWDQTEATQEMINDSVVSTSKGLAELTKSKQPTVQFIHESVRDFLLHRGGFGKLQPSSQENATGIGHEKLKQCCYAYVMMENTDLFPHQTLAETPSRNWSNMFLELTQRYPLLDYAIDHVLYHADAAESHGVAQGQFLGRFSCLKWILWDNFLQGFRGSHHSDTASLLYLLAEQNLPNLIRLEIQRVPHIDTREERFGFPSHAALYNGNEAALKALIAPHLLSGSASKTQFCGTPASGPKADQEDIQFLMKYGGAISASPMRSLLSWAVSEGHVTVVRLLLATGKVDVESTNTFGRTPLSEAVSCLIESLVKSSCGIEGGHSKLTDSSDQISLHVPTVKKYVGVIQMLIEAGKADANSKDSIGNTALLTVVHGGVETAVELLLQMKDVDINCRNQDQETPLHLAVKYGHTTIVKLLLQMRGVNVNCRNQDQETPLHYAAYLGHEGMIESLLKMGYNDADAADDGGDTPLCRAAIRGRDAAVKLLLDAPGVNVNHGGRNSNTPLHWAASEGHDAVVKLLLKVPGVDVNIENRNGDTPLHLAARRRHAAVILLLLKAPSIDSKVVEEFVEEYE